MVTVEDIRSATRDLALSGRPLCVHSSLSSFGRVEGGAPTVIEALLAEGCTVMVPTFSWGFAVPPPPGIRPERNGWDYDAWPGPTDGIGRIYRPDTNEVDTETMGAVPAAVVGMPGRVRGNNPLSSFTAIGPLAGGLMSGQAPLDLYAPFRALTEAHGSVVLMGVALVRMTLLHLAEKMAGRNQFRRWANGPDGQPMVVEAGGCSGGFGKFETILSPLMTQRTVGKSVWRVFPAREALQAAADAIRRDPHLTHCGDLECDRCEDSVRGGPILSGETALTRGDKPGA